MFTHKNRTNGAIRILPHVCLPQTIPFSSLERLGADIGEDNDAPNPDDVAVVMFTSTSLGAPKGLVATHKNIIAAINGLGVVRKQYCAEDDTYIAYLPLARVFELVLELLVFGTGTPIGYSSALTLTDASTGLAKDFRGDATLLRPTQMAAVPIIIDRICKSISGAVASKGVLFKELFDYAVQYKNFWYDHGFNTPLLNHFIFNDVRRVLGSRLRVLVCGSAPLSPRTRRFARACLCCHVVEAYGTTETCAVGTVSDIDDTSVGRVGAPVPGSYIRLVDWHEGSYFVSDKPNPRGEIVVGGPCVAQGYLNRKLLTRTAFRYETGVRWFYTGDVGEIFPDGTLKIIDRKNKETVKLQCGENASLVHAETVLRMCPLVDNVLVHGSSMDAYLVALVVPNNDQLQSLARRIYWVAGKALTLKELCEDRDVIRAASELIRTFARESGELQKSEVPVKVKLCADEWQPDTGLVTAIFETRRKALEDFYERDIKALYATAEHSLIAQE
ncbi:fatty acid CoA ligase Acsl3 [Rhipicephalus sanguineus]|uniref:fatty acid CoA ligase Acsl3 n=1 Tax=Rhipicephalus sanguineus TaxID=34632 RepID=UPI0018941FE8|nr:fatty acid CoA ligase Acsl3 [Rhipicephalus sanguineus]